MMKTNPWLRTLATASLLGTLLVGCTADPEEQEETSPSPTPTEAPTPTPVPVLNGQYRTSYFAIAPAGEGFDLDSSGDVDNNLPVVFDTINTELYNAILQALTTAGAADPQATTDQIWTLLETYGLILDVAVINSAFASDISNGSLIYLQHLSGTFPESTLDWYNGILNASREYTTQGSAIGNWTGSVDHASGAGVGGPGTFQYDLADALTLDVTSCMTEFTYRANEDGGTKGALLDGVMGGAILWSEIEAIMLSLLGKIPPSIELDEVAIVDKVHDVLVTNELLDVTINGSDAFSCAFLYTADYQTILGF